MYSLLFRGAAERAVIFLLFAAWVSVTMDTFAWTERARMHTNKRLNKWLDIIFGCVVNVFEIRMNSRISLELFYDASRYRYEYMSHIIPKSHMCDWTEIIPSVVVT